MVPAEHFDAESVVLRRPHLRDLPPAPKLPDGYLLRQVDEADETALAALLTAAFAAPQGDAARRDAWDVARVRERLIRTPDVRAVYVVERQGVLVATASSQSVPERYPGSGKVHWVGTRPDHQGRGLASALLARLLVDFAARGDTDAVLHTQTYRLPAIRRYFAFGFLPDFDPHGEDHRPRWCAAFQSLFGGNAARKG